MERAAFADMLRYRFIWLQHGVLQADFSRLINFLPLDLMVTTTQAEFDSVVGDGSPYRFTRKETVLAGLPRHDVMLAGKIEDRRTIVVMPTWRLSLTGPSVRAGNRRAINRAFYTSEFATRWKNLLHSPRLRAVADRGHRVVFVPHPNNEPYLDFFEVPSAFEVDTFHNGKKLRETFRRVSLYVTDYSSKAFDVAIMGKPVIYYQFDVSSVLGGAHLGLPGYFDYRRDGFGPVFNAEDEVLGEIERIAAGGVPDSVYGERATAAFPLRDGKSRERVLAAILAMTTKA
jgi:CDP-glycerol glycerophosphotransferase (TagB/SpsB family)